MRRVVLLHKEQEKGDQESIVEQEKSILNYIKISIKKIRTITKIYEFTK